MPGVREISYDAVVLAGGAGSRMGGVVKADLRVRGRRLLDLVLDATGGARQVVVVGQVRVPDGVLRTMEDPPGQGPAAGLAAGLAALRAPAPWVLVLACDLPGAQSATAPLVAAAGATGPQVDGVCLRDDTGKDQWLLALYRAAALREALAGRDLSGASMRSVAAALRLRPVASPDPWAAADVDTWEDLAGWA